MQQNDKVGGWHIDEDTGALVRDTIHRMGRRCQNWDYSGRGVYQITITLARREEALLGRLAFDEARGGAYVEKSELGAAVEALWAAIPRQWPGVEVLGLAIMPDHIHGVLRVNARQRKPLGAIIGSFKSKSTSWWLDHCRTRQGAQGAPIADRCSPARAPGLCAAEARADPCSPARAPGLWAAGYVDNILFDLAAVGHSLAYLADNPRRLWEKRAHPELFKVLRDLRVDLAMGEAHFAAIGNHALLTAPSRLQVQCSRRHFAYARDASGKPLKDAPPALASPEFCEKRDTLLAAAAHGAVLVSPCISEGEREIARLAFAAGHRVITLANKGFSPLYKPGGKLFDTCAAGNLLMLAPAAWPYLPGEKKMARVDACVLNFLASQIADAGAVEIVYQGITPNRVADAAKAAVAPTSSQPSP